MLALGAVSFLNPWALAAFGVLPLVWLVLRFLPPVPKRVLFPPLRLLRGLGVDESTSSRTPPWLTALRLLLLACLIGATAEPVLNARGDVYGEGPVVIVIDNGWAAAADWDVRRAVLLDWISRAERADRGVVLLGTATRDTDVPPAIVSPAAARRDAAALVPRPWGTDRAAALARLQTLETSRAGSVVWLSDGLSEPDGEAANDAWITGLRLFGPLTVVTDGTGRALVALSPTRDGGVLAVNARRADRRAGVDYHVLALGGDGTVLARAPLSFAPGEVAATASVDIPAELRERLDILRLEGIATAASTVVLDDRFRRRAVGLLEDGATGAPLLAPLYYLDRALAPLAEVRTGTLAVLLARPPSVIMMADPPALTAAQRTALEDWMASGGVLVRFAGPRLAKAPGPLVPVPLRVGGRALGGALSWDKPVRLGGFAESGPFRGLTAPKDVTVRRQVLAEPTPELAARTWVRLADGTPLVTARRQGDGWLVLVHTTANAAWSNLALSGVFVEMMERLVLLGQGGAADGGGVLAPLRLLDGFGRLGASTTGVTGVDADAVGRVRVGPAHPPGLYGQGGYRRALNLGPGLQDLAVLGALPRGVARENYGGEGEVGLRPAVLSLALVLALLDALAAIWLRGLMRWPRRAARAGALLALLAVLVPVAATAADAPPPASLETRLAYVQSGDAELDKILADGLRGLSVIVNRRSAAALASPAAVDPARDPLSLYPLLYWSVTPQMPVPDETAAARLAAYLEQGGVVLFDTGMGAVAGGTGGLRDIATALRLPVLVPVPNDHVLGRSFYLLPRFPGRWAVDTLWVERADERINDGVSAVIAGGGGWAAAWAMDEAQRFRMPVVPGGAAQREQALRFGINLVMYVLTGNYKSDQVHVPAILERLKP